MTAPGPLRAPALDGAVVAEPPLAEVGSLLALNRQRLRRPDRDLLGRSWSEMRQEARRSAVSEARAYLERCGEPVPEGDPASLVLAGHQPELFHPGVWVKNFALHGLARTHRVTTLNLLVDNDTVKSTALRFPAPAGPEAPWPHAVPVPFDRWTGETPYEERAVLDPALFRSFAERGLAVLRGWDYEPLLGSFWADVCRQAELAPLLGECFAAARRTLERRWGCHNLELPVSALCRTEPFARFACHLVADLPHFQSVYNGCVRAYRRRHGIRSRNHPVPDLQAEDGWLEAPFWGWRPGQARRGRLFVRAHADRLELRAGADPWPDLPPAPAGQTGRADALVTAWHDLETHGFKARSRALTNTLFARLFLGDLFVHGIGGGKYDELTDDILRRFYDVEPPAFLVLSGTRLLPLPASPARREDRLGLARMARDLHYNPQRHLDSTLSPPLQEWVRQKQAWVEREPTDAAGRRERFRALRELTEHLRAPLAERERQVRQKLVECDQALEANAVLRRRDYAFCLYPEAILRPFCTQFL